MTTRAVLLSLLFAFLCLLGVTPAPAEHVVLMGGPAKRHWETMRHPGDQHDRWWANFVRGSTIRFSHIFHKNPQASITWIAYKPGYVFRGKEDKVNYVKNIIDLAKKYKVRLVWVSSGEEAIKAINKTPRHGVAIESFYYFGHSNQYAFMLDYSCDLMGGSTQWIHSSDLDKINSSVFLPQADCWSYGCYTGKDMTRWWKQILGVPLWGNTEATNYVTVSEGLLPRGNGKWVK